MEPALRWHEQGLLRWYEALCCPLRCHRAGACEHLYGMSALVRWHLRLCCAVIKASAALPQGWAVPAGGKMAHASPPEVRYGMQRGAPPTPLPEVVARRRFSADSEPLCAPVALPDHMLRSFC